MVSGEWRAENIWTKSIRHQFMTCLTLFSQYIPSHLNETWYSIIRKGSQTVVLLCVLNRDCRLIPSLWVNRQTVPVIFPIELIFLYFRLRFGAPFSFLDSTGANTPVKGPFLTHLEHQAAWAISLTSRRTSCTAFAVWMPKKMYRISVNFVLALMRFRP